MTIVDRQSRRLQFEIASWCRAVNPDLPDRPQASRPYINGDPQRWQNA